MRRLFTEESKLGGWVSIVGAVLALSTSLLRYRRDHELEMPLYSFVVAVLFLINGVVHFVPPRKITKTTIYCLALACVAAFIGVVVHFHT